MEEELQRWIKKTWETKGTRFNAGKRNSQHDKWSSIAIYLVSVYIILLNLSIFIIDVDSPLFTDANVNYTTICLSIIVLIISLVLNSRNYNLRSSKFHDCGRDITKVYDEVCLLKANINTLSNQDIIDISEKYNTIIQKYDLNHSTLDYLMFRSQYPKNYNVTYPKLYRLWILFRYFADTQLRYWLFILSPFLIYLILKIISA